MFGVELMKNKRQEVRGATLFSLYYTMIDKQPTIMLNTQKVISRILIPLKNYFHSLKSMQ